MDLEKQAESIFLGDLVVSWLKRPMNLQFEPYSVHEETIPLLFLNLDILQKTTEEIRSFLVHILREITGELNLTWSIKDAIEMQLLTGNSSY